MEKVQWNSINKKQNELKQSNNEKSSTLPRNRVVFRTYCGTCKEKISEPQLPLMSVITNVCNN